MRFGRMYNGTVVSVTTTPPGRTIEQHVGEQMAEFYTALPDDADVGHKQDLDGNWTAPVVHEEEGVKA